jgi:hypothetical protein
MTLPRKKARQRQPARRTQPQGSGGGQVLDRVVYWRSFRFGRWLLPLVRAELCAVALPDALPLPLPLIDAAFDALFNVPIAWPLAEYAADAAPLAAPFAVPATCPASAQA